MADQGELGEKRIQFSEAKMQFRWDVGASDGYMPVEQYQDWFQAEG